MPGDDEYEKLKRFLSTPSVRRATPLGLIAEQKQTISIHALREEGDRTANWLALSWQYFYPRPP